MSKSNRRTQVGSAVPPRNKATQKDIARRAGVSQATVSSVLSGGLQRVAPETRELVLRVAAEAGYRANPLAQALKGVPTKLLGVVVRDLSAPAAGVVCCELARIAPEFDFDIVIMDAADSTATFLRMAWIMESHLCEGVVLVGELADQADLTWQSAPDIPIVGVLQSGMNAAFPVVTTDDSIGIREAVAHLASLGHEHIGFIGTTWLSGVQARVQEYVNAMRDRGLTVQNEDVVLTAANREGGAAALRELLRRPDRPLAVITATDMIASGVVREAQRLGVRVPTDLSVVGFDDIPEATILQPSLTTIRQPFREMAERVLYYFAEQRRKTKQEGVLAGLIPSRLVVRESTGPPRADRRHVSALTPWEYGRSGSTAESTWDRGPTPSPAPVGTLRDGVQSEGSKWVGERILGSGGVRADLD